MKPEINAPPPAPAPETPKVEAKVETSKVETPAQSAEVKTPWPEPVKVTTEAPKPPPAAPEELDFKIPEGEQVDAEFVKTFKETCKANGMTSKQAQAIVDLQYKRTSQYRDELKKLDTRNMDSLKSDKDFGGAKFNDNMEVAKKGFIKYGSPELTRKLTAMGLQSDPEIVKHFHRLGAASGEAQTPRPPNPSPEAATMEQALLDRYPNTKFDE